MCAHETQLILSYISCMLLTYPYADNGLVMQMRAGHFALKLSAGVLFRSCTGRNPDLGMPFYGLVACNANLMNIEVNCPTTKVRGRGSDWGP